MKFYILGPIIITIILSIIFFVGILQYYSIIKSKKIISYFLLPLRIISIIILLTLLLEPYLSYQEEILQNRLNIYIDNSKSIAYSNIKTDSLLRIISYFDRWSIDNELESKKFIFGDSVRLAPNKKIDFSDNSTNFFDLKSTIEKEQNATNLVISDGNSTQGYNLSNLKFDFPINFIGVGFIDFEDISISNINYPISINMRDSLNINFSINSIIKQETPCEIIIYSDSTQIYYEDIILDKGENSYNKQIQIPSDNFSGEFDIEIKNSLYSDNKFNNTYKGRTEVLKVTKSILLVSGGLNVNSSKIKDILHLIPNSSIKHIYRTPMGWSEQNKKIDPNDYDLIAYDNFPLNNMDRGMLSKLEKNYKKSNFIFFEGPSCNLNTFNQIYSDIDAQVIDDEKKYKLLLNEYQFNNFPTVRRNFKIDSNSFKIIYLEYSDSSVAIGENSKLLHISIPEISNLCLKDLSNQFEGYLSKIIYRYMDSGTSIKLHIPNREVYRNENLELYIESPDIYNYKNGELVVTNLDSTYSIKLNKIKMNDNGIRYIKAVNKGQNTLHINLFDDNNTYQSNEIVVIVNENNLEAKKIFRNIDEMRDIAIKSSGNYYDIEEYNTIKSSILNINKNRKKRVKLDVYSFDKFWFIILITLIIEWFFRKKKGLL